jgi:transcriptional regulator with GAF, ATPase, and Fis domain
MMFRNQENAPIQFADFTNRPATAPEKILQQMAKQGFMAQTYDLSVTTHGVSPFIILFFDKEATFEELIRFLKDCQSANIERILAVAMRSDAINLFKTRLLLHYGAVDVLDAENTEGVAACVMSRLARWQQIDRLLNTSFVRQNLIGQSVLWRNTLREIAEISLFSDANVLILGESGTGKEAVSRLIHEYDGRRDKKQFVTLDCTTVVPELAGSEFFGHEKGAYTNALASREGAFALANGGTLYLDEIGELPMTLQSELLRVVQEGVYKKVGSNSWQKTDFRLVCATNRELQSEIKDNHFRLDLFFRIAGWICRLPTLDERREDIPLLVNHFLQKKLGLPEPPVVDDMLMQLLMQRSYSGNIRELQQLINKIVASYVGKGPITVGCLPLREIPVPIQVFEEKAAVTDVLNFVPLVQAAVDKGWSLKEIKDAAADAAIEIAIGREKGNLQNAAKTLSVTDRTLQLWRVAHEKSA